MVQGALQCYHLFIFSLSLNSSRSSLVLRKNFTLQSFIPFYFIFSMISMCTRSLCSEVCTLLTASRYLESVLQIFSQFSGENPLTRLSEVS